MDIGTIWGAIPVSGETRRLGSSRACCIPANQEKTYMEPATSKRARILSKPDLITTIAVIVIVLLVNAVMLMILF
jgi:hypothetical protein